MPQWRRRCVGKYLSTPTMMSNRRVPPEIQDHIVDFLQDNRKALRQCCLVCKSWVPRTRKHLFGFVRFRRLRDIERWNKTFPDPSNSPAHHTHSLSMNPLTDVALAVAGEFDSVQTFSHIVHLEVTGDGESAPLWMYFPLFRSLNTIKSLRVISFFIPSSQVINLLHHFPLLEDLTLLGYDEPDEPQIITPTLAPLTGTLALNWSRGITYTIRRLLDLPNGLHFRKLRLSTFYVRAFLSMGKLVDACSDSLEHLDIELELGGVILSVHLVDWHSTRTTTRRWTYVRFDQLVPCDETQTHRVSM